MTDKPKNKQLTSYEKLKIKYDNIVIEVNALRAENSKLKNQLIEILLKQNEIKK